MGGRPVQKPDDEYITIFELAEWTKFRVSTLRGYVLKRTIPFHKINRAIRFKPDEIEIWIKNRGDKGQGELPLEDKA
jgi:hypothetical protein